MWKAQELLDSLNRECSLTDLNELYKALIAYELGIENYTQEINTKLSEVMEEYYDCDYIFSFINSDLLEIANIKMHQKK